VSTCLSKASEARLLPAKGELEGKDHGKFWVDLSSRSEEASCTPV